MSATDKQPDFSTDQRNKQVEPKRFQRKILCTGAAGFIGSHVAVHLAEKYENYLIVVIDKVGHASTPKNLSEVWDQKNFVFIKGDICDAKLMTHILHTYLIDTIIHLAAETHVDYSFGSPLSFTHANVTGTHVILEAVREHMQKCPFQVLLYVSTDEVYGESMFTDARKDGKTESDLLKPGNPYGATKACADVLCRAYHDCFRIPLVVARANNTYGPKQYPEKLIPKCISFLERDRPLYIYGDGKNLRTYIHAKDIARAYDLLVHKGDRDGGIYNIGTEFELSNNEVAHTLLEIFDKDPCTHLEYVPDRPKNDLRYLVNPTKINALGWKPTITFKEGLAQTVEWFRNNPNHWSDVEAALIPVPHASKCEMSPPPPVSAQKSEQ